MQLIHWSGPEQVYSKIFLESSQLVYLASDQSPGPNQITLWMGIKDIWWNRDEDFEQTD